MNDPLEFNFGDWKVDEEVYQDTGFVSNYVEHNELPDKSRDFSQDFAEGLESFADGSQGDAFRYCLGVGAREAYETKHGVQEVVELNKDAAYTAVLEDRGLMWVLSGLSPMGHGFRNAHRKTENICGQVMFNGLAGGFEEYRREQLDQNVW